MAANYVLLEKITVGAAGASSVTFSGIPQTGYTDLVIKHSTRESGTNTADSIYMRFNGSSTGYTNIQLRGNGSSTASYSGTDSLGGLTEGTTYTANTFASTDIYIPNYTSSNYKSISVDTVVENNGTQAYAEMQAVLWSNTAAITSIAFTNGSSLNWAPYTTFYLYGVAKLGTTPAIVPYATGGDTIMTNGTYWYHIFNSSGTFTPQKALSCDYLVVAGGGGSGNGTSWNAGGGAGGLRSTVTATGGGGSLESALSLASGTGYTVTIGAGGAAGVNGSNSVFSSITSTGGGRGGKDANGIDSTGASGGSGGGGSANTYAGGAGTANQGFAGGTGSGSNNGGGGGAGGVGGNASGATPGAAGAGLAVAITGSSVTYATGGNGGNTAANGTANTGNGANGSGSNNATGAGGSGIVIIRYAV